MKKITDQKFVNTFTRRFGDLKLSRQDLASSHVEVHGSNGGGGLLVKICCGQTSLVQLAWNQNGAWPLQSVARMFEALEHCNEDALARCVRDFLRKHDLVNGEGRSTMEWEDSTQIVLTAIGALGEAVAAENWAYARKMWDWMSPLHADLIEKDPTLAYVGIALRQKEALASPQMGGIH
jgi:hypothetical protein